MNIVDKIVFPDMLFYCLYKIHELIEKRAVNIAVKHIHRKDSEKEFWLLNNIYSPVEMWLRIFIKNQRERRRKVGKTHLPAEWFEWHKADCDKIEQSYYDPEIDYEWMDG